MTSNPVWVGRLWVKRRFVDITTPWERYTDAKGNTRVYIPAKVQDNPVLIEKDPWYLQYLEWIRRPITQSVVRMRLGSIWCKRCNIF